MSTPENMLLKNILFLNYLHRCVFVQIYRQCKRLMVRRGYGIPGTRVVEASGCEPLQEWYFCSNCWVITPGASNYSSQGLGRSHTPVLLSLINTTKDVTLIPGAGITILEGWAFFNQANYISSFPSQFTRLFSYKGTGCILNYEDFLKLILLLFMCEIYVYLSVSASVSNFLTVCACVYVTLHVTAHLWVSGLSFHTWCGKLLPTEPSISPRLWRLNKIFNYI